VDPPEWQGLLTSWHYQSLISQFSPAVPTNSSVCVVKSCWETQAKNSDSLGVDHEQWGHVRSSKSWMSEGKNLSLQRLVEFERLAEQKKTARE
jgi:hypothetical protein